MRSDKSQPKNSEEKELIRKEPQFLYSNERKQLKSYSVDFFMREGLRQKKTISAAMVVEKLKAFDPRNTDREYKKTFSDFFNKYTAQVSASWASARDDSKGNRELEIIHIVLDLFYVYQEKDMRLHSSEALQHCLVDPGYHPLFSAFQQYEAMISWLWVSDQPAEQKAFFGSLFDSVRIVLNNTNESPAIRMRAAHFLLTVSVCLGSTDPILDVLILESQTADEIIVLLHNADSENLVTLQRLMDQVVYFNASIFNFFKTLGINNSWEDKNRLAFLAFLEIGFNFPSEKVEKIENLPFISQRGKFDSLEMDNFLILSFVAKGLIEIRKLEEALGKGSSRDLVQLVFSPYFVIFLEDSFLNRLSTLSVEKHRLFIDMMPGLKKMQTLIERLKGYYLSTFEQDPHHATRFLLMPAVFTTLSPEECAHVLGSACMFLQSSLDANRVLLLFGPGKTFETITIGDIEHLFFGRYSNQYTRPLLESLVSVLNPLNPDFEDPVALGDMKDNLAAVSIGMLRKRMGITAACSELVFLALSHFVHRNGVTEAITWTNLPRHLRSANALLPRICFEDDRLSLKSAWWIDWVDDINRFVGILEKQITLLSGPLLTVMKKQPDALNSHISEVEAAFEPFIEYKNRLSKLGDTYQRLKRHLKPLIQYLEKHLQYIPEKRSNLTKKFRHAIRCLENEKDIIKAYYFHFIKLKEGESLARSLILKIAQAVQADRWVEEAQHCKPFDPQLWADAAPCSFDNFLARYDEPAARCNRPEL